MGIQWRLHNQMVPGRDIVASLQYNSGKINTSIDKFLMNGQQAVVHPIWTDGKPDSMQHMAKIVPLNVIGWKIMTMK